MKRRGCVQVYTGDGKGKTTAAVGLVCRAAGHGMKAAFVSFHKDPKRWHYGEFKSLKRLGADVFIFAKEHPHFYKDVDRRKIRIGCLNGLDCIKKIYSLKKYDILVCDEINIAIRDGFLKEEEVMEIIDAKPGSLELILTGRAASKKLCARADLVTEVRKVKHPYDSGMCGRRGIEY